MMLCRKLAYAKRFSRCLSTVTGLPFKIKKSDVGKIILDNKSFFEKDGDKDEINPKGIVKFKGDPIEKKYLPFHSACVRNLSSEFTGSYGRDRTEWYWTTVSDGKGGTRSVMQSRTVTDWYSCSGTVGGTNYELGTMTTQIYAGFEYPREHVEESLRTTDIYEMCKQDVDLSTNVSPHKMNMSYAIEKIVSSLNEMEEERIKRFIREHWNADHSRVKTLDMNLHTAKVDLHSFHLPAYIYTYGVDDATSLYKIISGYTGKLKGEKFYSPLKVGATWGFTGFVFGGLTLLSRANPYLTAGMMAARFIIPAITMGGISAAWAYSHSNNKYRMHRATIKEESAYNETTEETIDDKKRKVGSIGSKTNTTNNISLPESECRILGINHTMPLERSVLKSQYHKAIQKWHPDHYDGDKKLANDMTVRINNAYEKLEKLVI